MRRLAAILALALTPVGAQADILLNNYTNITEDTAGAIPCVELADRANAAGRLSADRARALAVQQTAVQLNDPAAVRDADRRIRQLSLRIQSNEMVRNLVGAREVNVRAELRPSSDGMAFLIGGGGYRSGPSRGVLQGVSLESALPTAVRAGTDSTKDPTWFRSQAVPVGSHAPGLGRDRPGIGVYPLGGTIGVCDGVDCPISDLPHVDIRTDAHTFCGGGLAGGSTLLRFSVKYSGAQFGREAVVVSFAVGSTAQPPAASPEAVEARRREFAALDGVLRDFVYAVLGPDQSYRVSDEPLRAVALVAPRRIRTVRQYIPGQGFAPPDLDDDTPPDEVATMRAALNTINDRAGPPADPDALLRHLRQDGDRYVYSGYGQVSVFVPTAGGRACLRFERAWPRAVLTEVWLDDRALMHPASRRGGELIVAGPSPCRITP